MGDEDEEDDEDEDTEEGHDDDEEEDDDEDTDVEEKYASHEKHSFEGGAQKPKWRSSIYSAAISDAPSTPLPTKHFGPAPAGRVHRRLKMKQRVPLRNGNLVVELAVPPKLLLPYRGDAEMQRTRYTAVTGDPDEFERRGFCLRQNELGRSTELFIVITMYNVSDIDYPTSSVNSKNL